MKQFLLLHRFISLQFVVYIFLCAVTFVSAFGPLVYAYVHAPVGTQYRFADGFFPDYYHYLMKIESGMMGKFGYYNRYTEIPQPVSYGHAIFPLMGQLGAVLGLYRADIVYLISRVVTLCLLFAVMYAAVTRLFAKARYRILAYILFFTGTSGYTVSRVGGVLRAVEPITFSGFYNALQKFPAPPQHLLASTLLLFVGIIAFRPVLTRAYWVVLIAGAFCIGMLQPFIGAVGVASVWFVVGWSILTKKEWRSAVRLAVIYTAASIVPLLYYAYLFKYVPPWTIWATNTFGYNYQIDFWGYLVANIMYLPFLVFLIPVARKLPRMYVFFLGWGAIIPTALFPFAARGTLLSLPRLLQVQQYIPLSILAAYAAETMLRSGGKALQRISIWLLCAAAILFAALPWRTTILDSFAWKQPGYYNVFIPDDFLSALTYLETRTSAESVVLTGEYMSDVIPAFTHNRVILGRSDVVTDYDTKLQGMYTVFGGHPDPVFVYNYLKKYRISYVLFGTDTPQFGVPYTSFPFLVPVFSRGSVTVVRVIR